MGRPEDWAGPGWHAREPRAGAARRARAASRACVRSSALGQEYLFLNFGKRWWIRICLCTLFDIFDVTSAWVFDTIGDYLNR